MTPTGSEPSVAEDHFTCPHCGVDASQKWAMRCWAGGTSQNHEDDDLARATCVLCNQHTYWVKESMVWPRPMVGHPPSPDMPEDFVEAYEEARQVAVVSPRAAAALLRMLIEQLVKRLTPDSKGTLHQRIGQLADDGSLPRRIIDSMDAVKLGGNNALHDGHIATDGSDDLWVVQMLFALTDNIVDNVISVPKWNEEFLAHRKRTDD